LLKSFRFLVDVRDVLQQETSIGPQAEKSQFKRITYTLVRPDMMNTATIVVINKNAFAVLASFQHMEAGPGGNEILVFDAVPSFHRVGERLIDHYQMGAGEFAARMCTLVLGANERGLPWQVWTQGSPSRQYNI